MPIFTVFPTFCEIEMSITLKKNIILHLNKSIMKQITSVALIMLVAASSVFAKDRASKHTTVKNDVVSVTYGKPLQKDGVSIPNGRAWRSGADEPTLVTLTKGCMFGGRQVSPGTYSLITVPNNNKWEILLNTDLSNGTLNYDAIKDKTVLMTTAEVDHNSPSVDVYTIDVNNDGIVISWDKNSVSIPVHPW